MVKNGFGELNDAYRGPHEAYLVGRRVSQQLCYVCLL